MLVRRGRTDSFGTARQSPRRLPGCGNNPSPTLPPLPHPQVRIYEHSSGMPPKCRRRISFLLLAITLGWGAPPRLWSPFKWHFGLLCVLLVFLQEVHVAQTRERTFALAACCYCLPSGVELSAGKAKCLVSGQVSARDKEQYGVRGRGSCCKTFIHVRIKGKRGVKIVKGIDISLKRWVH